MNIPGNQPKNGPVIASWPILRGNRFVEILADGLAEVGADLNSIGRPSDGVVGQASALLVQFPDQIFWHATSRKNLVSRAIRELRGLWRWRKANKTVVWIVHNNVPHDRTRFERFVWHAFTWVMARLVHGYMTLSPATQAEVLRVHSGLARKPFASFWHPAYPGVGRDQGAAERTRDQLGVARHQTLVGGIGMIRAYKGFDELVGLYKQVAGADSRLLVAGRPGSSTAEAEIKALASGRPDIVTDIRQLSEEEFAAYIAATDRLVAPYRGYLHSGFLVYAASAARMVLTPSTPFARDLSDLVGEGWISMYQPPLTAEALNAFIKRGAPPNPPDLSNLTAREAGQTIVDFVAELQGRAPRKQARGITPMS
jgi:glycosyltransferase involved in cell wall biosynthesis